MTAMTKVRRFGGSLGLIITKAVADTMALREGDELFVTGTPDAIGATPYDPKCAAAMNDAREFMRSHDDSFRELDQKRLRVVDHGGTRRLSAVDERAAPGPHGQRAASQDP